MRLLMILSLIALIIASLFIGEIAYGEIIEGALRRLTKKSVEWNALLDERVPRVIVIFSTGSSLAVSGAVMQSLFQNPLASPMVLGLSSGSSLFATIIFLLSWHILYPFSLPIASFIGCLSTLVFVYLLARKDGITTTHSLILSGIAFSTVLLALQSALLYAFRDHWELIQTFSEWEGGSSSDKTWSHVHLQLPPTIVGLYGSLWYRTELNLLSLGELEATSLGVEVSAVRWRLFLCVSLLTGAAIAAMGAIAFFGLILPHILRNLCRADHRILIPYCIFFGGATLLLFDLFLRAFFIQSLSISTISAIVGGIFFTSLLWRENRAEGYA